MAVVEVVVLEECSDLVVVYVELGEDTLGADSFAAGGPASLPITLKLVRLACEEEEGSLLSPLSRSSTILCGRYIVCTCECFQWGISIFGVVCNGIGTR